MTMSIRTALAAGGARPGRGCGSTAGHHAAVVPTCRDGENREPGTGRRPGPAARAAAYGWKFTENAVPLLFSAVGNAWRVPARVPVEVPSSGEVTKTPTRVCFLPL
jgi:hypothetical protein